MLRPARRLARLDELVGAVADALKKAIDSFLKKDWDSISGRPKKTERDLRLLGLKGRLSHREVAKRLGISTAAEQSAFRRKKPRAALIQALYRGLKEVMAKIGIYLQEETPSVETPQPSENVS